MANKSYAGRWLANTFPEDTAVRLDSESVGQRLFHALGTPMDEMDRDLVRMRANQYVATFNTDEVDVLYKATLPPSHAFTSVSGDPIYLQYANPVVQGLFINDTISGWFAVSGVNSNTLEELWYETLPDRVSLDTTLTSASHTLVSSADSTTFPKTTINDPHIDGYLVLDVNATNYSLIDTTEETIKRAKIIVKGISRKGLEEEETLVFPWSMKQKTLQQWQEIDRIDVYDFPSGVMIGAYSGDYANGPYLDSYNLAYSEYRNKVDLFWDIGVVGSVPTLDKVGYISDMWQVLVTGNDSKEIKRSWQMLDTGMNTVSGVDLAVQPFTTRAWIVDGNNQLYVYDLAETMADDISSIRDRTAGAHVKLEFEAKHVVLNETIKFYPYFERPLSEVKRYRVWYQTPSGTQYGLSSQLPVAFTSNFWVTGSDTIERRLEPITNLAASERGDWIFAVETEFDRGETHTHKAIVTVDHKQALAQYDLSGIVATAIDGIDFDSDQRLWVKSGTSYYRLNLHWDRMLIDFYDKVIYFRENYTAVDVT